MLNVQQGADFHVFPGLGHYPFIGGNDHRNHINTRSAGNHVFYKLFVTGYIDDAQMLTTRKFHGSESEFNGDTPELFFLQPVRIDAGNGFDQGCLSMVNVTGCTEDDLFQRLISPELSKTAPVRLVPPKFLT